MQRNTGLRQCQELQVMCEYLESVVMEVGHYDHNVVSVPDAGLNAHDIVRASATVDSRHCPHETNGTHTN